MSFSLRSEPIRIIAAAVGASLATYIALELYRTSTLKKRRKDLGDQINRNVYKNGSPDQHSLAHLETFADRQLPEAYDPSLIREQLTRNYSFFGEEGMERVRNGSVAIVGCGGVGSWAAVMLLRSGVSTLRLIDFDMVTLSSLNRHAVATLADVGTPKVIACQKFLKKVAPWANIEAHVELWQSGSKGEALLQGVDWVVDAIDNIGTKVNLLKYCHNEGIKVFASMGAGAKCDPTRVQISDISNTYEDPLARSVRRRLRLEGVLAGILVVYSTEIPNDIRLLPLPEEEFQKGAVHELGPFDDFRVRILPVIGPLPSIFGLHIATYILCDLAGKPILNPLATKNRKKLYEKLLRELSARESKRSGTLQERLPIDETDVAYVFEDLNRGRSTIPPHAVLSRPYLSRWDLKKPLTIDNCVVLSQEDYALLEKLGGSGEGVAVWTGGAKQEEVVTLVKSRIQEAQIWKMNFNGI